MIQDDIRITISDIDVDQWYYSFQYTVSVNGNMVIDQSYENDHAWADDQKGFVEHLEKGGATLIVLEECLPPNLFEL